MGSRGETRGGTGVHLIRKPYGSHQGRDIDLYTISNDGGLVVSLTTFGGTITSIRVPDRFGRPINVLQGRASLVEYRDDPACLGAVIGRCADRISSASFKIDGVSYTLSANCGRHHLHGGFAGFAKKVWEALPIRESRGCGVQLSLTSPDGDEGYPGTVDVQALYLLTMDNRLIVEFTAASDRATAINLTQNLCLNLAGGGPVDEHHLRIHASGHVPVNGERLPFGTLKKVDGTLLDLRSFRSLGSLRADLKERLGDTGCLSLYFALTDGGDAGTGAAALVHPASGRSVTVRTSQPCLHLQSGFPCCRGEETDDAAPAEGDEAVCLLPQHFPDSPNQRAFPSVILPSGRRYRQVASYHFEVMTSSGRRSL